MTECCRPICSRVALEIAQVKDGWHFNVQFQLFNLQLLTLEPT